MHVPCQGEIINAVAMLTVVIKICSSLDVAREEMNETHTFSNFALWQKSSISINQLIAVSIGLA